MSRFCEQCGSELQPNENFCSNCGAKIIRDEPKTYTPPKPSPSSESKSTSVESRSPPAENHMGKFIALIGILVIVFIGIYHANENATDKKSETALGEFYLGMSKSEADSKFGAGIHVDEGDWYEYDDFWVTFDSANKARKIIAFVDGVRTKKGIHVGSTLDEVKRAYGNGYEFNNTTFYIDPAYIYEVGHSKLFFFIDTATDTVIGIRLDAK